MIVSPPAIVKALKMHAHFRIGSILDMVWRRSMMHHYQRILCDNEACHKKLGVVAASLLRRHDRQRGGWLGGFAIDLAYNLDIR